jgi:hypothetical protein
VQQKKRSYKTRLICNIFWTFKKSWQS